MRKTDKKIDNQLRNLLTDVCDFATDSVDGFEWLTHRVNYSKFPESLHIVCIFDTYKNLGDYKLLDDKLLAPLIQAKLNTMGIKFKDISAHVSYDCEEYCLKDHDGNWAKRLGRH
ncbi:Fis family transcriptional regulator [Thalassotalea piscium]